MSRCHQQSICVVRFPNLKIDQERFQEALKGVWETIYVYNAKTHQAPLETNCVTVLRYLLRKSSEISLPATWLGDLPRMLAICYGCQLHRVAISDVRLGDLLFFRKGIEDKIGLEFRWIPHVAIAIGNGQFFHSSWIRKGGNVEHFCMPQDGYAHRLVDRIIRSARVFLYIDPRNKVMRQKYGEHIWVRLCKQPRDKTRLLDEPGNACL